MRFDGFLESFIKYGLKRVVGRQVEFVPCFQQRVEQNLGIEQGPVGNQSVADEDAKRRPLPFKEGIRQFNGRVPVQVLRRGQTLCFDHPKSIRFVRQQ